MTRISRREFLLKGSASAAAVLLRRPFLQSAIPLSEFVESLWSGALSPNAIRVNAKVDHNSTTVRLLVSNSPDLSNPLTSPFYTADQNLNNRMVGMAVNGLTPGTQYYYGIESQGALDHANQGSFRTPIGGPQSFTFAFGNCAQTGSAHQVFETILAHVPLFFLHTGDLHYQNIEENDRDLYRTAFDNVLASPTQSALYRQVPIIYMWDDHDYGPNNSDGTAPGREAARLTYQEYVPHYPLAAGSGNVPIYQAFTVGRVRFLLTDLRSERTSSAAPDDPAKTMLGNPQKAWFKNQLLAAKNQHAAIVWVSSVPWISPAVAGSDFWAGYTMERQELAQFIHDNGIANLLMLCGDAHMVAIDDGSNTNYAAGGTGFPLMHGGALDQDGSLKGGPYSHGAYPGRGQFGLVTVEDFGDDNVTITLSGRNASDDVIVQYQFTHNCCAYKDRLHLPTVFR